MPRRLHIARPVLGLLILAFFAAWIGAASFHHHAPSTPCEICKVLQSTHATLPGDPPRLTRGLATHRLEAIDLCAGPVSTPSLPHGRAPPLA